MPHRNSRRTNPRPRPEEGSEPEKRRAILHAAVRVFAAKGYHGCRIADVARQAGVAYGLVYHYFQNKDELLESVFAEQWTILLNALEAIRSGPGTSLEQLASVCRFVLDVFRTAPDAVRVLILEVARAPDSLRAGSTRQTFEAAVRLVSEMVRRGQETGEIRHELDPMVTAACLLGAIELTLTGLVLGILGGPSPSEQEIERLEGQVVATVLGGLASTRR